MSKIKFRTKEGRRGLLTLTLEDAADLLGISIYLARIMASTGQLPTIRLGKKLIRVPRVKLEQMLAADTKPKQQD